MTESSQTDVDLEQIKLLLPHRAPFLFVERLSDIVPFQSATGYKAVSYNEPYFMGHFPRFAVMPGVLIIEALAQTAGALVMHSKGGQGEGRAVYFMTVDKARFRRPVRPGNMLRMPVQAIRSRGGVFKFEGKAFVDDQLCAEASFSAMIAEGDGAVPPRDSQ